MTPVTAFALAVLLAGSALLSEAVPWCRRPPLTRRLRPHSRASADGAPATPRTDRSDRVWWLDVATPTVRRLGDLTSRALGATEPLERRLSGAAWSTTVDDFRLRQLQHGLAGLAAGALVATVVHRRPVLALAALLAGPVLGAMVEEQRLAAALSDRRRRIRLELPVVAEQLAMLVGAGASLPAALARLGERGSGVVAEDLRRVVRRVRHGLDAAAALDEWADATDDDAVRRLVSVLALHREATDLGRLIAHEARSTRQESHRELVESIERRAQLVWIPVTVATLVPGVLFLSVPFVAALSGVAGT